MGPEIGRCASDDAVVVARETLRFRESLFAAGRAAVPIRMFRGVSVIGGEDGFGLDRRFMERSISKVNHLLWMVEREAGATSLPGSDRCVVSCPCCLLF